MAKSPSKRSGKAAGETIKLPDAATMPDDEHPAFQNGLVSEFDEGDPEAFTPVPGGPLPGPFPGPLPGPFPGPLPQPRPTVPRLPTPGPFPRPQPFPISFCGPVSGRYRLRPTPQRHPPIAPTPVPIVPRPQPFPVLPINVVSITVRVDVDRYYPQNRISIQATRLFPRSAAHVIAEVTSDSCIGFFRRRIQGSITYRDGDASLIPGDQVLFEASRGRGFTYSTYRLTLSGSGGTTRTYDLDFDSQYFDPVEFEVDCVADAGAPTTTYDTGSHPNRPGSLPSETISLKTVYQRAGFAATLSPNVSVIPVSGAGANNTWSDAEMHNAMVTFWSRFADRPQWAMWVLFARRHDIGRGLGGIMFDDIGDNHRQGTAIFTDSFIQDVPPGDPSPAAWRRRMVFWTAVHEMGHAFNLAHSWQKSLGRPQVEGDPWIPLTDAPEARSFMNYPFRVSGGESAFFSNFEFRFTDDELVFMRHAPRRFVQMGNEDWFENHGFEDGTAAAREVGLRLALRPNRERNRYRFLEPVNLELKLENVSGQPLAVDPHCLDDGRHIGVIVEREGGRPKKWRPFATYCHETHVGTLEPGQSIYGAHFIGASTEGWLIDEPGFYRVQAAVEVGGAMVRSNVLRLYVSPPAEEAENVVAPDYFSEDVARVLAFDGAPGLEKATAVLEELVDRCAANPAAGHATVALSTPLLRPFKVLKPAETRAELSFDSGAVKIGEAAKKQSDALFKKPEAAAESFGHLHYFSAAARLTDALADAGEKSQAKTVQNKIVDTMNKRNVLASVIERAKRRLEQLK